MRQQFRHALAERQTSEPLVVAVELSDHTVGYGETHPRPYVSGETTQSAIDAIRDVFMPRLVEMRPASFGEAIEAAAGLPLVDDAGRIVTAARAAVELALLDAWSRSFGRSLESIAGWLEELSLGPPGSSRAVRYSGVLSPAAPRQLISKLRRMRCYGLRDFKLKVGQDGDDEQVRAAVDLLRNPIRKQRATLRLDANAAWTSAEQAREALARWSDLPIACVEQPMPRGDTSKWAGLCETTGIALMADESLVTPDDAQSLVSQRAVGWFNIRISKNGGLIPALRLAVVARRNRIAYQLGCMVGETSLLSAAGRWFLQLVPAVRFAEGSYGRFLLTDDITRPRFNLRYGGRPGSIEGPGLGVEVLPDKLRRYAIADPIEIPL